MAEIGKDLPALVMCASLAQLPALTLPQGIAIRSFLDDDEDAWNQIISIAFRSPYDFNEHMKKDPAYKAERVLFAQVDDVLVATAAAWTVKDCAADTGYLHMVGALPEYKGRKLGYLICLAAMHKLKQDGFVRVRLNTDDFRLAAIKTYLALGFELDLTVHESMPERWEKIKNLLNV